MNILIILERFFDIKLLILLFLYIVIIITTLLLLMNSNKKMDIIFNYINYLNFVLF